MAIGRDLTPTLGHIVRSEERSNIYGGDQVVSMLWQRELLQDSVFLVEHATEVERGATEGEGSMSFHFPSTSMSKAKQPSYGIGQ